MNVESLLGALYAGGETDIILLDSDWNILLKTFERVELGIIDWHLSYAKVTRISREDGFYRIYTDFKRKKEGVEGETDG